MLLHSDDLAGALHNRRVCGRQVGDWNGSIVLLVLWQQGTRDSQERLEEGHGVSLSVSLFTFFRSKNYLQIPASTDPAEFVALLLESGDVAESEQDHL